MQRKLIAIFLTNKIAPSSSISITYTKNIFIRAVYYTSGLAESWQLSSSRIKEAGNPHFLDASNIGIRAYLSRHDLPIFYLTGIKIILINVGTRRAIASGALSSFRCPSVARAALSGVSRPSSTTRRLCAARWGPVEYAPAFFPTHSLAPRASCSTDVA
jgi:hypothetical protein